MYILSPVFILAVLLSLAKVTPTEILDLILPYEVKVPGFNSPAL